MVRRSLRSSLWLFAVALGVLAQPLHAQSSAVPVKTYTGYFNNTAVYFTAFETNSSNFAAANGLVWAPRLSNSQVAGLANMIFFQNGSAGQTTVLQTEPGMADYSPLWHVITAVWRGPGAMPLIPSYQAALQWRQMGNLALQSTGIVFNGPVVWMNMSLNRQGGQLAPTISPIEFAGINPAARTVFLMAHPGYFGGQLVSFLALEHAPGVISQAPGAIPVPLIDLAHLGHAAIDNFFVVPGQPPVLDAFPNRQLVGNPGSPATTPGTVVYGGTGVAGSTGQTPQQPVGGVSGGQTPQQPVGNTYAPPAVGGEFGPAMGSDMNSLPFYSLGPYAGLYSPIWHVHRVMFRPGIAARLIGSVQDLAAALSSGLAVQIDGGTQDTFNCPIVSGGQAYVPPGNPNANPVGNPVYTPPSAGMNPNPGYTPPSPGMNPSSGGTPGYTPPTPGGTPPPY